MDACKRAQRANDSRDRLCGSLTHCLPDFPRSEDVLRDLRRIPVPDALLAAPAHRRTQYDVGGSVAYRPCLAALYACNLDVQHVRSARYVGAAGLEFSRIAARHDVCRALRRRGHAASAGGPARAGSALEGQIAASLRVGRQNSALFAREEWNWRPKGQVPFAGYCAISGG